MTVAKLKIQAKEKRMELMKRLKFTDQYINHYFSNNK